MNNDFLKILIVSETYPPDLNGAAIFTQRLAEGLARRGHQVRVLGPSNDFTDKQKIENYGVGIYRFKSIGIKPIHPYFRVIYRPGINRKIKNYIEDFKPDIIHIQNHFILGRAALNAAQELDIPIIGTNHFMPENLIQYLPGLLIGRISQLMWEDFLRVYNKLAYVTAPSNAAIKIVKNLGLTVPIQVISNGIDLAKFKKRVVPSSFSHQYKIDFRLPLFLFVGRLEKDKNIELLLMAIKQVLKTQKVRMILVGCGKNELEFKALSKELGLEEYVTFAGRVSDEDLLNFYSIANVYMATGVAELQGLAVMEAMASELPILAINAVALPELVRNEVNGFLFEPNEHDFAQKMIRMLSLKPGALKQMGENSLKIIKKHDAGKTYVAFEKLYRLIQESALNLNSLRFPSK
ncbi:TPA: hypothetical protein DGH83_02650 [Candidatus Peregrinibacteria bacterium]|nr:hypothetical protein [Candidatus Peregrinibacteria bacterium]